MLILILLEVCLCGRLWWDKGQLLWESSTKS